LKTLKPEFLADIGSAQGRKQRIHKATVNLFRTVGLEIGFDEEVLDRLPFRNVDDNMNEAVPLFTGTKDVVFNGGWSVGAQIVLRQQQPLPFTCLSIIPRIDVGKP